VAVTPKQEKFCKAYLANGLNATQAAITAGYSARTAASIGEENLKKPEIAKAIAQHTQKVMAALDYGVERVLQQVARMAFFDPRKLYDPKGNLKPIHELDDDTVPALAGREVEEGGRGLIVTKRKGKSGRNQTSAVPVTRTAKIKLADRGSALDKLMRYHALYKDKLDVKVDVTDELAEKIAKAQARAKKGKA
ncbi:MAG: terminase small subunit, partial [Terriglobus sp.]